MDSAPSLGGGLQVPGQHWGAALTLSHSERDVMDVLTFVFLFALILGSGMVATNICWRLANSRCASQGNVNAIRRTEHRNCRQSLGFGPSHVHSNHIGGEFDQRFQRLGVF